VVMRMLVRGVRQTTRCGPNLFSLTQLAVPSQPGQAQAAFTAALAEAL
jgi:hypothetical protein